jgi:tetratricopeptide (TPR) repeat protein
MLPDNRVSGVLGALAALAVHSLVDGPLLIPLDACVAAVLCGLLMPLRASRTVFPGRIRDVLPERLVLGGITLAACLVLWGRPGWEALYRDTVQAEAVGEPAEWIARLKNSPDFWYLWALTDQCLQEAARTAATADEAAAVEHAAMFALGRAAELNPTAPGLLGELAAREWLAGEFDAARAAYRRLFKLQPDDVGEQIDWMYIEWYSGHRDAAREIVKQGVPLVSKPERGVSLWRALAALEASRGSSHRRLDALRRAAALKPDMPAVLWDIARCERDLGYRRDELRTLVRISEISPDDWRAWWRLAELYAEQKRGGLLNHALRNALERNPRLRPKVDALWKKATGK